MNDLQQTMFNELKTRKILDQTQQYVYEYLNAAFDRHVYPTQEALDELVQFEEPLPGPSTPPGEVLAMLHQYGAPATVTNIGGRYFGMVNGSATPVGLAAKQLAGCWDQNAVLQATSPIAAKLEAVVEQWLKDLFELPPEVVAGFVSGTSMANYCGLAAARYRLLQRQGWDINEKGMFGAPQIRVVAGRHAHSTILKTVALLGFGKDNIEWVDVDEQGRMLPSQLPPLDDKSILILQAGNVNSGAFDPFDQLVAMGKKAGAWIHIDGAFGLWAAAAKQLSYLTNGIQQANSWAVDGHKTLNTPYDSGIVLCNDQQAMVAALHMKAGYIVLSDGRDGMFYTPEMSKRARIIELWATLKYLGRQGLDELVTGLHRRAVQFANAIKKIPGFEVINEVVFNQVMVRCSSDERTEKVAARIQALRECWVGTSTWNGTRIIRVSVCSWATTQADIQRSVASFEKALLLTKNNG